jgi:hypothetical protein
MPKRTKKKKKTPRKKSMFGASPWLRDVGHGDLRDEEDRDI